MRIIPFKTCLPFSSHNKMINSPLWLHTGRFSHLHTGLRPKAGKYLSILVYISPFRVSAGRRSCGLEDFLPSLVIKIQKNNPTKLITTQPSVPSNYYEPLPFRKATLELNLTALSTCIALQFSESFGSDSCSNNRVWVFGMQQYCRSTWCSDSAQLVETGQAGA